MIAAERQHGHGVAADLADDSAGGRRHFRAHGGAHVDASAPVEGLVHEWHGGGAAAAEDNRADGHAARVFPCRVDGGALYCRGRKASVGIRGLRTGFSCDLRRPLLALPVEALGGWLLRHTLPPHSPLGRQRDVSKNGVLRHRSHRHRVGLERRTEGDTEEAGLGVDRLQAAARVWLDPGDIVAHRPHLPALESRGRNQHGKVRLAASARESGSDVGLLALWVFDSEDEHVLRHPAFVARHVGGNAQGEAFLAEKGVAAVAGAVGPDLASLGEVHDVFLLVAGPGHVLLTRC